MTLYIETSYGRVTQSFHFVDSKSAGAYTRRGQLNWLGEAWRVRLTRSQVKIEIGRQLFHFWGKAVKIGRGPATVIGCRWNARVVLQRAGRTGPSNPPLADSQSKPKVREPPPTGRTRHP